jgi:hypothetical protein
MGRGAPGLDTVERLVGQLDLPAAEFLEQHCWWPGWAMGGPQPRQSRLWVVHREQVLGEWDERGPDASGAVVEKFSKLIGEGAAGAEAISVERVLVSAA